MFPLQRTPAGVRQHAIWRLISIGRRLLLKVVPILPFSARKRDAEIESDLRTAFDMIRHPPSRHQGLIRVVCKVFFVFLFCDGGTHHRDLRSSHVECPNCGFILNGWKPLLSSTVKFSIQSVFGTQRWLCRGQQNVKKVTLARGEGGYNL